MENILLGIVQGLTEFLPVSSSGHLAIFTAIFNKTPDVGYFAFLHLATFLAVVIFVKKEIFEIINGVFKKDEKYITLSLKLFVSMIPAAIVGIFFEDFIKSIFSETFFIGVFLAITGVFMLLSDKMDKNLKTITKIPYLDAFIIGIFQAFSVLPGISRSGSTLFAALLLGVKKEDAVKYSFLMSLPVIFGAGVLEMQKTVITKEYVYGFIVAFLTGILGLHLLKKMVIAGKLKFFGYYCFLASLFVIFYI
ncbi:Bacitracin resistance protein BacA [Methanococcus vannielii SB]|uniref:Undecaprenyl-diphosphatase n=1 Tax=Methanococcus vannielii (strain ATCC 35089 / DSM 1224 / JCM 13029 / OCM 148 / SB) TaxID=406327 RepID=UPPP_METVS|nr:undecaprenyl-diphosphate phosphatase [Methanococcus vannielii]A6UPF1.1 RecName: Full=Undecaprenyl-diphosphatase; AltName: Full=Undecaprenyl pyrophosphate phosphatase [Methanococcus vannielii SB]ABR54373.1 Bacitracin resistance protein BacA [Methanococcus vannielii SB]